jgi:uncharacterized protein (DUF1330 family)
MDLSPADASPLDEHDILAALKTTSKERDMPKGYWVISGDVTDPEGYKAYIAANATALTKYGARFLVRGGKSEVVEGRGYSRTVVVEFKDFDMALACYHSPEYAEAKAFREGKADLNIAVIEGYDGPQPGA